MIGLLLKASLEERLSDEAILRQPWLHEPAVVWRAEALMDTKRQTRKRLLGQEEAGVLGGEKRKRLSEDGPGAQATGLPGRQALLRLPCSSSPPPNRRLSPLV